MSVSSVLSSSSLTHSSRSPRLSRPTEADLALSQLSRTDASPEGVARRRFLQGSLAVGGAAGLTITPGILDQMAAAATPLAVTDKILVTVFLNGGNDHLNMLAPAEDGAYLAARGALAVDVDGSTAVGEGLHLHPNLTRTKARFDAGQVALIRGVGEASDDHSHFTSSATWMSGIQNMLPATGWLGRFQDGAGLNNLGAVSVGWNGVPLLLRGSTSSAVSLPPGGHLFGAGNAEPWETAAFNVLSDLGGSGAGVGIYGATVASAFADAVDTAQSISPAFADTLAADGLARELGLAAQVINLNLGTQLVNVSLGGFDTHDSQRPHHDNLMAELDAGLDAFFNNLSPVFAARTSVLVFSEFGRRVAANSTGTDHGTAGFMMLLGADVNGGLHGAQPSLTSLDRRGDMQHQVDFRSVYATVLDQWLKADSREVLGASYPALDLFDAGGGGSLFMDVGSTAYYAPAVGWLAATGVTQGTSPSMFSPDEQVTRGQMATFLHRYVGQPTGAPTNGFSDVPSGHFYSKAIDWLATSGITTGTSATTFSPEDPVTRAQMAAFLWRMEGKPKSPVAAFSDVRRDRYYAPAVDWLLERGVTTGTSAGKFSPDDVVTRGQMATFLWRLAGSPA